MLCIRQSHPLLTSSRHHVLLQSAPLLPLMIYCNCAVCVQVFGSLTAGWEEDDSTGDDNSSVGVLSHGGSSDSYGPKAAAGVGGGGGLGDDSIEGEGSMIPSEDSGF
jgi:hypothetical protein